MNEIEPAAPFASIPDPAVTPPLRQTGRLVAWACLVGALASISYAGRIAGTATPDDVLYLWSTFVGALVQYGIMFVLVLAIAHGLDRRLLALRIPEDRWRAVRRAILALVIIVASSAILSQFLDAGDEQGLVPKGWDSSRAIPFLANAAVVTLVAPFVEELLFRGLGYGLLTQFVLPVPAVVITGFSFGLAHGLVLGLPVLTIFGITLGWLRWQTGSVYPGMIIHCLFNASALLAAVAL
jgi:membrane protease YdiL (CAAX protease family)